MPTSFRPLTRALAPLALPLLLARAAPVRAEELSLKVENYIFAASEALGDGDAALALSLLRRAKAEAPGSCIVDEYLCRAYAALGNAEMARQSYARFAACMEVTDEGVLAELDALVTGLGSPPAAAPVAPPAPAPASVDLAPAAIGSTAAPASGYPHRGVGWALFGGGAALAAGLGATSAITWSRGEGYVEQGQQADYEALIPWNHAAVVGAGVGGGLALTGVLVEIALARHGRRAVALAPAGAGLAVEVRR
jgi:hypothetical protein